MIFVTNSYSFIPVLDADAKTYINAVESADGQSLENPVKVAINNFVIGCKNDDIWTALKASCILAGARTLSGALVPLVGTAPTNNNFVSGDYNRKTGLKGNASTKYLNSNRNNNADPQDSKHIFTWLTERIPSASVSGQRTIGTNSVSGGSFFGVGTGTPPTGLFHRLHSSSSRSTMPAAANIGGHGLSRSSSANYSIISANVTGTQPDASTAPNNENIGVFGYIGGFRVAARISFYSIGEGVVLAQLNSRVSTLMTSLAAAIP